MPTGSRSVLTAIPTAMVAVTAMSRANRKPTRRWVADPLAPSVGIQKRMSPTAPVSTWTARNPLKGHMERGVKGGTGRDGTVSRSGGIGLILLADSLPRPGNGRQHGRGEAIPA